MEALKLRGLNEITFKTSLQTKHRVSALSYTGLCRAYIPMVVQIKSKEE